MTVRAWPFRVFAVVLVLLVSGLTATASTPTPQLVLNLDAQRATLGSVYGSGAVEGELFFVFGELSTGVELWRTDGTSTGTSIVRDLRPGMEGSNPEALMPLEGTLFFRAFDGSRRGLWRTDGSADGTDLVLELAQGPTKPGGAHGRLYFTGARPGGPFSLFVSDGSAAGTVALSAPGGAALNGSRDFVEAGASTLFVTDGAPAGLWKTDGTSAGTQLLHSGTVGALVSTGGVAYFTAGSARRHQLWMTDGSSVSLLHDFQPTAPNAIISVLLIHQGVLYFTATGTGSAHDLYRWDPGQGGNPVPLGLDALSWQPGSLAPIGAHLYFVAAVPGGGFAPHRTTGLPGEVQDLRSASLPKSTTVQRFFALDDAAVFFDRWPEPVLVRVDPQTGGLSPAVTFPAGVEDLGERLAAHPAGLLFSLETESGEQLWWSDGTQTGTTRLTEPAPQGGAEPSTLTRIGGRVFFSANRHLEGFRAWFTDGTAAGTTGTGQPKTGSTIPFEDAAAHAGRVYFNRDGLLWSSDGTEIGTTEVLHAGSKFWVRAMQSFKGSLYVSGSAGTKAGLWRIDSGHLATLVYEAPTDLTREMTATDDLLFFRSRLPSGGDALLRSDGTTAGTFPAFTTQGGSFPLKPRPFGSLVLFLARGQQNGQLYRTDGTPGGTLQLHTGAVDPYFDTPQKYAAESFAAAETWAAFSVSSAAGLELWRTDGTKAGTRKLVTLTSTPGGGPGWDFFAHGDDVYLFVNEHPTGRSLWRSDGTVSGTQRLASFPEHSDPLLSSCIAAGESHVYFSAYTPERGMELWRSDGTVDGTEPLPEIRPGPASANPCEFTTLKNKLLFRASDSQGAELWSLELREPDTTPPDITAQYSVMPGGNGWFDKPVTVSWQVVDPETPVAVLQGCAKTILPAESPQVSLTCAAESEGGKTTSDVLLGVDQTPPVIRCPPMRQTVLPGGEVEATVSWFITAEDALSGVEEVKSHPASGTAFPVGSTEVEALARDKAGNIARCTFAVVVDATPENKEPAPREEAPDGGCACSSNTQTLSTVGLMAAVLLAFASRRRAR